MKIDKEIYSTLVLYLERFKNICDIESLKTTEKDFCHFANLVHDINDQLYLLELIDNKEDEII